MAERLRRAVPVLGFVAAGFVAGVVLVGSGEASEETPTTATAELPAPVVADSRVVGEAAEQRSSTGGAEPAAESPDVAAVRFLEMTEEVVRLSPTDGALAQRSIASEASADRLSNEVFETLTGLANDVPDGVAVQIAPIGVSSAETATGWDVSIWYVEVVVYGSELAVEQWRTATYSLVEEGGKWRMDSLVSTDGPVPTRPASAVAWSTSAFIAGMAGFDDEVLEP